MDPWVNKAHAWIYAICEESYKNVNVKPNGRKYKLHRPYSVPELAKILIECVRTDNEEGAKLIFLQHNGRTSAEKLYI